jgi:hypothetical protein
MYTYVGTYKNSDSTEKVYSYEFKIRDNSGALIASSGEQLHNITSDDKTTESNDIWTTTCRLDPSRDYTIDYSIKTVNGLEKTSPAYRIQDGVSIPSTILDYYNFVAINHRDEASVELALEPVDMVNKKIINGKFNILRSSSEDNFSSWH